MKMENLALLGIVGIGLYFLLNRNNSGGGGGGGYYGSGFYGSGSPGGGGGDGSGGDGLPPGKGSTIGIKYTTSAVVTKSVVPGKFVLSYPQYGIVGNAPRATPIGFNFIKPPPIKF